MSVKSNEMSAAQSNSHVAVSARIFVISTKILHHVQFLLFNVSLNILNLVRYDTQMSVNAMNEMSVA